MKIPSIYFAYFGLALLAGIIFSFGITGFYHQPVPLQVQLQQYQPANPPAPAIPTIAPANPSKEPFAPAPAPVVVTTQPLPTITPTETKSVGMCDVGAGDKATSIKCTMLQMAKMMSTATVSCGVGLIVAGFAGFLYALMGITSFDDGYGGGRRSGGRSSIIISSITAIVIGGILIIMGNVIPEIFLNMGLNTLPP